MLDSKQYYLGRTFKQFKPRTASRVFVFEVFALGIFAFLFIPFFATAAVITWDGGGADNNWSTADNWAGGVAPTSSDVATFDDTSTKDASIDTSIDVQGIDINSGYTGTITDDASSTIAIGSSGYNQADGTFTGGTSAIDINDASFSLSGGTFTNSSGNMTVEQNFTVSGGTFNNTGTTVTFDGGSGDITTITCSEVLEGTFIISQATGPNIGVTLESGCTIDLGADPTTTFGRRGFDNNGTITIPSGTWTVESNPETFTNNGTITHSGDGWDFNIASLTNASGSTITYSGTAITIENNFTQEGTFDLSGKTITFDGDGGSDDTTLTCGSPIEADVILDKANANFAFGSDCTIQGDFTRTDGQVSNPGTARTFTLEGDFSMSASDDFGGSNLTLVMGGGNSQSITHNAGTFQSLFQVNKTGGTASLSTSFTTTTENCDVVEGTFDFNGKGFICGGTFTVQDGGTLHIQSVETDIVDTIFQSGSTVVYQGDGDGSADTDLRVQGATYDNLTVDFTDATDEFEDPSNNTLEDDLQGYWKFDEGSGGTTADDSGNGNTGTLTDTTWIASTPSVEFTNPNALAFNGTSSVVTVDSDPALEGFSAVTLSAWIFPTASAQSAGSRIISKSDGGTADDYALSLSSGEVVSVRITTSSQQNHPSVDSVNLNTWTHVAAVWDGSEMRVYINGLQSGGSTAQSGTLQDSNERLSFGAHADGPTNRRFEGNIDDVRVYNRALKDDEILSLAQGNNNNAISSLDINSNFTLSSGTWVSPTTMNVAGNWSKTGGTFTPNSGTVTFDATSGTATIDAGGSAFDNLVFNDAAGTATFQPTSALDVNGTFTLTDGVLDLDTSDPNLNIAGNTTFDGGSVTKGAGTVTFDGDLTYTDNVGSINLGAITIGSSPDTTTLASDFLCDSLTIDTGDSLVTDGYDIDCEGAITVSGTLNASDAGGRTSTIALTGNWANTGTFTPGSSTVDLDGTDQTINNSTTFANLKKEVSSAATLTFASSTTQTITNTLTLKGASGNLLSLRSSTDGTQWEIDPQGAKDIEFVDVQDSNNINATAIECVDLNCTDSGNNTNWTFVAAESSSSSSGQTAGNRVQNLIAMGNYELAQELIDKQPHLFSEQEKRLVRERLERQEDQEFSGFRLRQQIQELQMNLIPLLEQLVALLQQRLNEASQ